MPEGTLDAALLTKIQKHEANAAIGASALRGQVKDTRKNVVGFLSRIDLERVPAQDQAAFDKWLDDQTRRLQRRLPDSRKPWGVARKALNLFLRSCVYNHFLREVHGLEAVERWLEVPLDSKVAGGLIRASVHKPQEERLPRWKGLGDGSLRENSARFQAHATRMANEKRLPARVFLDHYLFLA